MVIVDWVCRKQMSSWQHKILLVLVCCMMLLSCQSLWSRGLRRSSGLLSAPAVLSTFGGSFSDARYASTRGYVDGGKGDRRSGDHRVKRDSRRTTNNKRDFRRPASSGGCKNSDISSIKSAHNNNSTSKTNVAGKDVGSVNFTPPIDIQVPGITAKVVVEKGKSRLFQEGNPIVFSGAVQEVHGNPVAGEEVLLTDHLGNVIGRGVYNPHSQYRVRLLAWKAEDSLFALPLQDLLTARIRTSVALRSSLGLPSKHTTAYRLINSEGDLLSGLIVDVLGDYVVAQSSAYWVEQHREVVQEALKQALTANNSTAVPQLVWKQAENRLKQDAYPITTNVDNEAEVKTAGSTTILENDIAFTAAPEIDQKTGFYCDQRDNRMLIRQLVQQSSLSNTKKDVLDLYCYSGGFAMNAVKGGAGKVVAVDSSRHALDTAMHNAQLNQISSENILSVEEYLNTKEDDGKTSIQWLEGDCVAVMQAMVAARRSFDVVICDPPKLAPTMQSLDKAFSKYRNINALAMQLVQPNKGGLLLTCTCSAAMTQSERDGKSFLDMIQQAARQAKRNVRVLQQSSAAMDHVSTLAFPQSTYLKAVLLYVY